MDSATPGPGQPSNAQLLQQNFYLYKVLRMGSNNQTIYETDSNTASQPSHRFNQLSGYLVSARHADNHFHKERHP